MSRQVCTKFARLFKNTSNLFSDTMKTTSLPNHGSVNLVRSSLNVLPKITFSHVTVPRRNFSRTIAAAAEVIDSTDSSPSSSYDAAQIQVLQGLDPVRKRPGMYIGSTGQRGLHHLIYEILDNSIDEVQAGHAHTVTIQLDLKTGWVTVTDDGRGIPIDLHPATGKSALETVLTVLHAGGKFGGSSSGYSVSGGLHGVGLSVVNALSTDLEVSVWRDGVQYSQSYKRGEPQTSLEQRPPAIAVDDNNRDEKRTTGTSVSFKYDESIFAKTATFDPDTIRSRLRELAFLNSAATIKFRALGEKGTSSHNGKTTTNQSDWEVYHYSGGLTEYVTFLNRDKEAFHEPLSYTKTVNGVTVDVAMQWCSDSFSDTIIGFVNSIKTIDGGTHIDGFKSTLTRTVNGLARKVKTLKEGDPNLSGEHIREGLGVVVSVKVPNPEFEGQTKTRLGNPEVRKVVEGVVASAVGEALESDPGTFGKILAKALQAHKAAEAAKKARELVRRKSVLTKSTLPGKLADCTSNVKDETEIFIVEGDSAGGSAKQARDRRFQAILPLRGKILNVERQDDAKLYKNNELSSLIVGLGLGLKGEDNCDGLRYGKIIILTDADVDGAHIRTLLLTFLFRYQRALFEQGRVYAGVPPLFKVERGSTGKKDGTIYCFTDQELADVKARLPEGSYTVQRFKGLGEMMPLQLWETTLNPARRTLRKLTLEDAAEASHMFTLLMGDKVGPRRELIERHGSRLTMEDLDF